MTSYKQDPMKSEQAILPEDIDYLCRAIALGAEAEAEGNIPIGAIVVMEGRVIAEARNKVLFPEFHPGRHAEIEAMNMIRGDYLHHHSKNMTLYTTQEPCVMCLGAIILYRIGRVVYGGMDPKRGAVYLQEHLAKIYDLKSLPVFIGPLMPEICDPLFDRADKVYRSYRDKKN